MLMHQTYHIALLIYGSFYAYIRKQATELELKLQVELTPVEDNTNITS
jgi:hypothetical protein